MRVNIFLVVLLAAVLVPGLALADGLTKMIQQDLVTLGFDPGNTDGEASTETIVAISEFQAGNNLEVTGEPSPQLAGIIKAAIKKRNSPASEASVAASSPPPRDAASLQAAQQACLQEKIAAAENANKKKRGFGSLMRAASRTASRFGGSDMAQAISETSRDVYDINATASDLSSAARDLGITEDEIEQCRDPL